jgi:hypothetical protein
MLCVVGAGLASGQAFACGDKYLVCGQGEHYRQLHASAHPSAILIYRRPDSLVGKDVLGLRLQRTLQEVGHTVAVCDDFQECRTAITSANYDFVLMDLSDADRLKDTVEAKQSRPRILPVVLKAPKEETRQARQDFGAVVDAGKEVTRVVASIETAISSGH